jgi:hypothetical protein
VVEAAITIRGGETPIMRGCSALSSYSSLDILCIGEFFNVINCVEENLPDHANYCIVSRSRQRELSLSFLSQISVGKRGEERYRYIKKIGIFFVFEEEND